MSGPPGISRHPLPPSVMVRLVRTTHAFLRRRRRPAPATGEPADHEEAARRAFEAGRRQGHAEGLADAEAFFTRAHAGLRREVEIARQTTGLGKRRRGI